MEQHTPTTRSEFESRRIVPVILADGTTILCRRTTIRDLLLLGAAPGALLSAAQGLRGTVDMTDSVDRVMSVRLGLERIAEFVALDPPISLTRESKNAAAIWVGLLTTEELGSLFATVTGAPPTGAAAAESFRGGAGADAQGAPLHGEGVRETAEQLAPVGSMESDHG